VLRSGSGESVINRPPGYRSFILINGSGSLLFYQRFQEIVEKVPCFREKKYYDLLTIWKCPGRIRDSES
jgi:hypothetical protein